MDSTCKGIASVGNIIYQKFEAMCSEMDDIMPQEGLKYVENQLQTVGANVKQFCSDIVIDVLLRSSMDTVESPVSELSFSQNTERAYEMTEAAMHKDHFEKEPGSVNHWSHLCSAVPVTVAQHDLYSEEAVDTSNGGKSGVSIAENHSEGKQITLKMLYKITPAEKDPMLSALSLASDDLMGSKSSTNVALIDMPTSNSVNIVDSFESDVLDNELTSSDAEDESVTPAADLAASVSEPSSIRQFYLCNNSAQLELILSPYEIGKSNECIGDVTDVGSSYKVKLDESCILVDRVELSSVSREVGRLWSYQKKFKEAFAKKKRAAKQDHDQLAACYGKPDLGSSQLEEVSPSSSISTSDHEFCDSDWEII